MRFAEISGNEALLKALSGMIVSGHVPHAIMLHEDDGCGAVPIALAFLQRLYCSTDAADSCGECPSCNKISKLIHPDVHFIFPTAASTTSLDYIKAWRELVLGNPAFTSAQFLESLGLGGKPVMIGVGESKQLVSELGLSALEGGYRSVVIYLPELMNQEAANRLLKLIEEPPVLTQFVLVTHSPEKVLKTISSRCQCLRVAPSGKAVASDSGSAQRRELLFALMDKLVSKDLLSALELSEQIASLPTRESQKAFCLEASALCRELFLRQQGLLPLMKEDEEKYAEWAAKCKKTFPRNAVSALDRAVVLLGRNVNSKIVFTDLVCRLNCK